MSSEAIFTSRRGEIPCGDRELYLFLTDMRNFKSLVPNRSVSAWESTEDYCSFKVDKVGKVSAELSEALPYTLVSYFAETFMTGRVSVSVTIDSVTRDKSEIILTISAKLNPFLKMVLGNSAERYLDQVITMIENYDGYDRIKGCTQSP